MRRAISVCVLTSALVAGLDRRALGIRRDADEQPERDPRKAPGGQEVDRHEVHEPVGRGGQGLLAGLRRDPDGADRADEADARPARELRRGHAGQLAHRREGRQAARRLDQARSGRGQAAGRIRRRGDEGAAGQEGRALPPDRERVPRAAPVRSRRHRAAGQVAHRRTE